MTDSKQHLKLLLTEMTETLRHRVEVIKLLQKNLDDQDATIRHLQNELDKYRQIVGLNLSSGIIGPIQRMKRQAISAEPLTKDTTAITKVHKPQRFVSFSALRLNV
ncbi:hypothetical protein K0M31_009956 [Melipona bicolor]|uniref:Uncharacterized protein n=1 Tax=Melipona bicolor TaxID=60889 RepID=A0AA40FMW0_9HYME|nr:hypothetical protein K0M31_009956 [Melipona bicolor]